MKKLFYLLLIITLSVSCSVSEESTSDDGSSDGTASSPMELTIGTAKSGGIAYNGYSYYKFTTSSSGAGSYKLAIASMTVTDGWLSSRAVTTFLNSDSGYSSSDKIDTDYCAASCTINFDYDENLDASKTYYLKLSAYGTLTYSLTVSRGGSEGSKNNPVELTLGTAHSGTIDNIDYVWSGYGYSFYKFETSAADNYTLTMNNSDSLDCQLYSNSGFTTVVDYYYNECTVGANILDNFTGSDAQWGTPGSGLSANTDYYLKIDGESSTHKTTTYNITVQAASEL